MGRLPAGLMQLVLSPYGQDMPSPAAEQPRLGEAVNFFRFFLPPLNRLRHLAFHHLQEIGDSLLQNVCTAAKALPQLISLHLVRLCLGPWRCTMLYSMAQHTMAQSIAEIDGKLLIVAVLASATSDPKLAVMR